MNRWLSCDDGGTHIFALVAFFTQGVCLAIGCFLTVNVRTRRRRRRVASSAFPFGSKLMPRVYGLPLSLSVRQSAIADKRYPFSLWAVCLFDAKLSVHAGYFVSHFQGFTQRSNSKSTATALHIRRRKALIPFLSPTRLSFWLLSLSPGKIVNILFWLRANTKRKHVSSCVYSVDYSCFIFFARCFCSCI